MVRFARSGTLGRPIFVVAFFAMIAVPLLVTLTGIHTGRNHENRVLASPPTLVLSRASLRSFPSRADAWVNDHFGLRTMLVRVNNFVLWHMFGEMSDVGLIAGKHGRLFLGAHDGAAPGSLITEVCGAERSDTAIASSAASIRGALAGLHARGLDATLLIAPTAARLYPEDLPRRLALVCAGQRPAADRLVARLAGEDVVYPVETLLALKHDHVTPIPAHHFHWLGEAPLRVAELVAESHWGLARITPLPLRWIGRASDIGDLNPGMALSDTVREPQVKAVGTRDCVAAACATEAGLLPGAARAIEHYYRPGAGPELLVIADSFGDEIERDFIEQFASVWIVHTNVWDGLMPQDRAALASWIECRFHGRHVLLIYHDLAASYGLTSVQALLGAMPAAAEPGRIPDNHASCSSLVH